MDEEADTAVHAAYDFGFRLPFGLFKSPPLHESIAIAAFIHTKHAGLRMNRATTTQTLTAEQWEYFRGLIWPDDPRCLIFNDRRYNNRDYGYGVEWTTEFKFGENWTMTRRSHFGDLQYLHAMGSQIGEPPEETREKLLDFMSVMYRLATGQDGVDEKDSVTKHFAEEVFGDDYRETSLRDLLLATTPSYIAADIPRRALGVCLHIIQDSYAVGHVKRELLNPEDQLERVEGNGYIHFRPGTHGIWGDVLCFHTYVGQSSMRHKHYDGVPRTFEDPRPGDLSTFDPIIGARSAIDGCRTFLKMFANDLPWDEVRAVLEAGIFKLHPDAQPSDVNVDMSSKQPKMSLEVQPSEKPSSETFPIEKTSHPSKDVETDIEYWAGHDDKLHGLDGGNKLERKRTARLNKLEIRRTTRTDLAVVLGVSTIVLCLLVVLGWVIIPEHRYRLQNWLERAWTEVTSER